MRQVKIATWNINSVRMRRLIVERLLNEAAPDVLFLQETKCQDGQFPAADFRKLGYEHIALNGGRGGYHGVGIVSRLPLGDVRVHEFCEKVGDPRHISAVIGEGNSAFRVHNFYVPAGGDEPDVAINPKFEHKLRFLDEMGLRSLTELPALTELEKIMDLVDVSQTEPAAAPAPEEEV